MFDSFPLLEESALNDLHELQIEGEPSFVGVLVSEYLSQLDTLTENIEKAQAAGDLLGLEQASHKLKSSSGALGLSRVAAVCAAIEKNARAGRSSPTETSVLRDSCRESKDRLKAYIAKMA